MREVIYSNCTFSNFAIHQVGNEHRGEKNFVSSQTVEISPELEQSLRPYYFKAMDKAQDLYRFIGIGEMEVNDVRECVKNIFEDSDKLLEESQKILWHLSAQSGHPNIKSEDVHVVYFKDILIQDEVTDGIGIFKAENKSKFIKSTKGEEEALQIDLQIGFSLEKLDKGCIILDTMKDDGYRALVSGREIAREKFSTIVSK